MRISTPNFHNLIKNPLVIIIPLLAISLLLLFLPLKLSNQIKATCVTPIRPLQWATCFCSNSASNFFDKIISPWRDAQAKKQLEEQISQLTNKIIEQQDTIYKLQNKLSMLSKFQIEDKNVKTSVIPADIIGYDTSNFRKSITINAGSKQGVKVNHIVVSNNTLIGRIITVGSGSSMVQLITDPASRIPGRILQTREQVIVEGNATAFCQLKYIPRWAKLKEGDDIVSSDIGGLYPPSLPIGTVMQNEIKGGALFRSVKVLPMVNISKIESVLVLTN
ncbi:MAG: rod shape-determining protein MreC [Candidatus Jettenia sp.]|uniref:Cell shape-determining protein MreC n=1 Tax=Candidatus Jettenia caeni TaxID=247490 RepID=I3IJ71_9BACT|nr:rod shape-determining protein MreC [Candidatus Jettenia sp. AMX1]MBC6927499.1 rod shape-determining protein MreC [Candidatus Jettenia sp.]NUN22027.1 rod shape-determining protein MreC [Candidatus Jettenia caeni]KAA0249785.1 MAG: rod shape-determining protein MreC [Candidatus Jettenia sp. AMX1]MCE7879181.1 rod shape-determining protein MreC [Candidatus Jettenia sp. AMX1]MCQ3925700.1 rod shape-determining protein MreC [Candidatus Jettenia sp.]